MKKYLFLAFALVALVACGGDDNPWQDNPGGGNRPVHASKYVSKIIISGDIPYDDEVSIDFVYDKDNRPEQITFSGVRGDVPCIAEIRVNHGRNMARCEIRKFRDGNEYSDKSHKVIVLDNFGRAVSGDYIDFDFDSEGKYVREEAQFELAYDRAGRLTRSKVSLLGGHTSENLMTWHGNNLTSISYRENGADHVDKAYYSDVLNKSNLDLNWLCYIRNRGFHMLTGDPDNLFFLLGYCGKSSRNLPEMIIDAGDSKTSRSFLTYEVDKEGYATRIRIEQGNDMIDCRILYTK